MKIPSKKLGTFGSKIENDIYKEEDEIKSIEAQVNQLNERISDRPQDSKDNILTTQTVYENGYEVWSIHSMKDEPVHIWLYIKERQVAPKIDESKLAMSFP